MDRATVRQQVAELARQYTDEALPQIPEIIALARRLATDGPNTETQGAGRFDASFCPHCHEKLNESLQVACRIWRWESPELAAGGDDGIMVEVREGLGLFNIDILEVKNGWADIDRPLFSVTLRERGWMEELRDAQRPPQVN